MKYSLIFIFAVIGYCAAAGHYIPKSFYTIDKDGNISPVQSLSRLRRQVFPNQGFGQFPTFQFPNIQPGAPGSVTSGVSSHQSVTRFGDDDPVITGTSSHISSHGNRYTQTTTHIGPDGKVQQQQTSGRVKRQENIAVDGDTQKQTQVQEKPDGQRQLQSQVNKDGGQQFQTQSSGGPEGLSQTQSQGSLPESNPVRTVPQENIPVESVPAQGEVIPPHPTETAPHPIPAQQQGVPISQNSGIPQQQGGSIPQPQQPQGYQPFPQQGFPFQQPAFPFPQPAFGFMQPGFPNAFGNAFPNQGFVQPVGTNLLNNRFGEEDGNTVVSGQSSFVSNNNGHVQGTSTFVRPDGQVVTTQFGNNKPGTLANRFGEENGSGGVVTGQTSTFSSNNGVVQGTNTVLRPDGQVVTTQYGNKKPGGTVTRFGDGESTVITGQPVFPNAFVGNPFPAFPNPGFIQPIVPNLLNNRFGDDGNTVVSGQSSIISNNNGHVQGTSTFVRPDGQVVTTQYGNKNPGGTVNRFGDENGSGGVVTGQTSTFSSNNGVVQGTNTVLRPDGQVVTTQFGPGGTGTRFAHSGPYGQYSHPTYGQSSYSYGGFNQG